MDDILSLALQLADFRLMPVEWFILNNLWDDSLRFVFENNNTRSLIDDAYRRNRVFIQLQLQLEQHEMPTQVKKFISDWIKFSDALILYQCELYKSIGLLSLSPESEHTTLIGTDDTTPILIRIIMEAINKRTNEECHDLKMGLNNAMNIDSGGPIACTLMPIYSYLEANQPFPDAESPHEKNIIDKMTSIETIEKLTSSIQQRSDERLDEFQREVAAKNLTQKSSKKPSQNGVSLFFKRLLPKTHDNNIEMVNLNLTKHS